MLDPCAQRRAGLRCTVLLFDSTRGSDPPVRLQESRVVRVIKKQLVKRCLDMMDDLAKRGEDEYDKFWSQFGRYLKLGLVDDAANKERLAKLVRVRCPRLCDACGLCCAVDVSGPVDGLVYIPAKACGLWTQQDSPAAQTAGASAKSSATHRAPRLSSG